MRASERAVAGVYLIRNVLTGDTYLGQAVDLLTRKRSHFRLLERRRHSNRMLQASYDAHGPGAFVFEVLEAHRPQFGLQLSSRERGWRERLRPTFDTMLACTGRPNLKSRATRTAKRAARSSAGGVAGPQCLQPAF